MKRKRRETWLDAADAQAIRTDAPVLAVVPFTRVTVGV
jgi:hypothetical protein